MELKSYQHKVINDLEKYLEYVQRFGKKDIAFNKFWTDRLGNYDPLTGEGMQPYKNTIPGAAHVCIKVPTAGGKTFIACNALNSIFKASSDKLSKVVVWLVPWSNLLSQTVNNLRNPDHPYRQKLNALFNNRVEVYEKKDLLQASNFNPVVIKEQLTIIVMSYSSLRAKNKEDRKVYQENGNLAPFTQAYQDKSALLPDVDDTALINVIRNLLPVLVVDESHNAESVLSVEMLNALNPSFVLDLTATPKENSNIISLVPAIELKKEHMVKLPVIVYNHHDKTEVINSALHLQQKLEQLAIEQEKNGGKYIRPIILFQAQPKTGEDNTTFERLKAQLLGAGIREKEIKIKTADIDELKGINLLSKDCEVRYIITINALKEGWDCPFAYILASLADKSSAVDVEQILGRVLRQPYVMKHTAPLLNLSYVLTASVKFQETLKNIVDGLKESGFSDRDYRPKNIMPENEVKTLPAESLNEFRFPESFENKNQQSEINPERISFSFDDKPTNTNAIVDDIAQMAVAQNAEMETLIKEQEEQTSDENILADMGPKMKRFSIIEGHKNAAAAIMLPQFYISVPRNGFFETDTVLLNQETLLKHFNLAKEDIKIDFSQVSSDLYKIDIERTRQDEYDPRFTKIEDFNIKTQVIDYILAKPKEGQIKDITYQLIKLIGSMLPITYAEIKAYVEKILNHLTPEQLQDILIRKLSYAERIKMKIKQNAEAFAETQFNEWKKIGRITTKPNWKFREKIMPGLLGPPISNSLYEREGEMNTFEANVITDISGMSNIDFWHRNLVRGFGFAINGFINHYPDFIVYTKTGNVIIVEAKGDDRDNSDSAAKCRLGNTWAQSPENKFFYFMVFDQKPIDGAYTADRAKALIAQL